jgi:hypothetical protein
MCTAMLYDPQDHYEPAETIEYFNQNTKGFERLLNYKRWKFLQPFLRKDRDQDKKKGGKGLAGTIIGFFINLF